MLSPHVGSSLDSAGPLFSTVVAGEVVGQLTCFVSLRNHLSSLLKVQSLESCVSYCLYVLLFQMGRYGQALLFYLS